MDATTTPVTIATLRTQAAALGLTVPSKAKKADIVAMIEAAEVPTPTTPADLFTDEGTYGAAELAAALDMEAYDLRVILRDLGYGVGKGRKYGFDMGDANVAARAVRSYIATHVTDNA
jgi:hypothetical protein